MDIRSYIRKTIGKLLAVIAWTPILYACDGLIYDGEGDCSVNYRVKFCYDYNMKFADAFAHEVNVVTLYLLDVDGSVSTISGGSFSIISSACLPLSASPTT